MQMRLDDLKIMTFDIGDGIGDGENYRVCGYTPGDLLDIIFQSCDRYTHGYDDEWVSVSAKMCSV